MLDSATLKVTTLSENTVANGKVGGEWGLCILIEAVEQKILLDTGMADTALQNAYRLGVDLGDVDTIVLSHSHIDHTGGLSAILPTVNDGVQVLGHPDVWDLKYGHIKDTGEYFYLGIPYRREYLESLGAKFDLAEGPQWITEDIATSGEVPMVTEYEPASDMFFRKEGDDYLADSVADDLSLFIRTELGLVIVLGCAHRGIINVIRHAQDVMDTKDIYMVVGGTHLIAASDERLDKTVEALRKIEVVWLGVSHCTGLPASARLSSEFPDRFFTNNAGNVITFPHE